MRTSTNATLATLTAALLLAVPDAAHAGRGASLSSIQSAIRSNSPDAIQAELERAERLVCGACIEPVMELLDHESYQVREVAAWWFARRPVQKRELHERSVARLHGDDPILARNAADVLGTFRHPDAIPALSHAAVRGDLPSIARAAAVKALGTIAHPSAEPVIVAALADAAAEVRLEAVQAYHELRGSRTGEPLVGLLADGDLEVRRRASAVLGAHRLATARGAFEQLLAHDPDAIVRRNAAWALGRIGDAAARPALEKAAQEDPASIVRSVARASIRGLR